MIGIKQIIKVTLTLSLAFSACPSLAECKWSLGIKETSDGYLYTPECHLQVGKLVEQNKKIPTLEELYDLQRQRADMWKSTALDLDKKLTYREHMSWLYVGAGVLFTFASVWAAGQL